MAIDDRVLRLENAFITLSELAAKSDTRTARLEESFVMLTELAVITNERLDDHKEQLDSH